MKSRKPRELETDLDMTTFINLMVVLLAFLLVTAVFTELSMLQVNLPSDGGGPGNGAAADKPPIVLEVMIYKDRFIVADRNSGPIGIVPATPAGLDFKGLNGFLTDKVKARWPAVKDVTILMEPNTEYDTLVHTMDAVRYHPTQINGQWEKSELFPNMGIGDAPSDPNAGGKS
jgi:biopolymer transport protein ExbD